MNAHRKPSQAGQFAIEMVLLMSVLVGFMVFATRTLRESNALSKLVQGPWESVAGMIECGEWGTQQEACKSHPAQRRRALSVKVE